jgi:hypothetical protein
MTEVKPAPNVPADETRAVGRGVIAIAFAKLYFILTGLVVQFGLPRLLKWALIRQGVAPDLAPLEAKGLYGDYKLVNDTTSLLNNSMVTGTIQTVSKFAAEGEEGLGTLKRRALAFQLMVGGAIALSYALLAGPIAGYQLADTGAASAAAEDRLAALMRLSAIIVLAYAVYAIYIGVLNGRRRFVGQAGFDITYSTLRSAAILGAVAAGLGLFGIFGAFAASAVFI